MQCLSVVQCLILCIAVIIYVHCLIIYMHGSLLICGADYLCSVQCVFDYFPAHLIMSLDDVVRIPAKHMEAMFSFGSVTKSRRVPG